MSMSLRRKGMSSEYKPVAVDDSGINSFELESGRNHRQPGSSHNSNCRLVFAASISLLVLIIGYGAYQKGYGGDGGGSIDDMKAKAKAIAEQEAKSPFFLLAYGDSLTFGLSDGTNEPTPYAKFLEDDLNVLYDPEYVKGSTKPSTVIQHFGLPGLTAELMLRRANGETYGICTLMERFGEKLRMVIILAGTNDIGTLTNTDKSVARRIVSSITDLHETTWGCAKDNPHFRTVAIGIPDSAFQEKVPSAFEIRTYVNEGVETFAKAHQEKMTYVDFPIPYEDSENSKLWAKDGIHLTPAGYEEFAKLLAPTVKSALDSEA